MANEKTTAIDRPESKPTKKRDDLLELQRRSWELELLISGAIVIALFKVPTMLDVGFDLVSPHLSQQLFMLPFMLYYVAKLLIYSLLATFILHILVRGYWVGLVGLGSAFPNGVRWEVLKLGPVTRKVQARDIADPLELEPKVDRLASALFATLSAALGIMAMMAMMVVLSVLGTVILRRLGVGIAADRLLTGIFLALVVTNSAPLGLINWLDLRYEKKGVEPPPWLERWASRSLTIYRYTCFGFMWMPITQTLMSNLSSGEAKVGAKHGVVFSTALVMPPILVFLATMIGPGLARDFDSYVYAPRSSMEGSMDSRNYRTSRDPYKRLRRPLIPAPTIEGRYLELFLPYDPRWDNQALEAICPEVEPLRADGEFASADDDPEPEHLAAILGCFGQLWDLRLDGEPLMVEPIFSVDPESRTRGLTMMIPIAQLEAGRHLIEVDKRLDLALDEEIVSSWIPFWI